MSESSTRLQIFLLVAGLLIVSIASYFIANNKNIELQSKVTKLEVGSTLYESQLNVLRNELNEKNREINTLTDSVDNLESQLQIIQSELSSLDDQISAREQTITSTDNTQTLFEFVRIDQVPFQISYSRAINVTGYKEVQLTYHIDWSYDTLNLYWSEKGDPNLGHAIRFYDESDLWQGTMNLKVGGNYLIIAVYQATDIENVSSEFLVYASK